MKQYCRYCAYMCCGNGNYCSVHERTFSDSYIKTVNSCGEFCFCEIDALDLTKRYKPRKRIVVDDNQMRLF